MVVLFVLLTNSGTQDLPRSCDKEHAFMSWLVEFGVLFGILGTAMRSLAQKEIKLMILAFFWPGPLLQENIHLISASGKV